MQEDVAIDLKDPMKVCGLQPLHVGQNVSDLPNDHVSRGNVNAVNGTSEPSEQSRDYENHRLFLKAMDELPDDCPQTELISRLSKSLNWESRQVETHAYRYFISLIESEQDRWGPDEETLEDPKQWTQDEAVLFDTLLAAYGDGLQNFSDELKHSWIPRVAAHFPGRTAADMRHRWLQLNEEKTALNECESGENGD